jgi:hypothetical protein
VDPERERRRNEIQSELQRLMAQSSRAKDDAERRDLQSRIQELMLEVGMIGAADAADENSE